MSSPRRVLYMSSPIGLGHARRDVAIAAALRERHPGVRIDWLAQHPVTRVLAEAGETVHPASRWLANETAHIEDEAGDHDVRLPFAKPVDDVTGLSQAIRVLMGCPFLNGLRARRI